MNGARRRLACLLGRIGLGLALWLAAVPAWGGDKSTAPEPSLPPDATGQTAAPAEAELAPCPHCGNGQWLAPDCPEHGVRRRTMASWFQGGFASARTPLSSEETWLYRPVNAGVFFGAAFGSDLIKDWVGQKSGYLGGLRVGWDFDPYWGVEVRYAVGDIRLYDSVREFRKAAEIHAATGMIFVENARYSGRNFLDASLLFYPWGDVRLRPYILFGIGYVSIRFDDLLGNHYSHTTFGIPVAAGVKYLCTDRLALRFEINDTIIMGGDKTETVQDVSFTGGLEVRLGGSRRSYWPWNPGDQYW